MAESHIGRISLRSKLCTEKQSPTDLGRGGGRKGRRDWWIRVRPKTRPWFTKSRDLNGFQIEVQQCYINGLGQTAYNKLGNIIINERQSIFSRDIMNCRTDNSLPRMQFIDRLSASIDNNNNNNNDDVYTRRLNLLNAPSIASVAASL